LFWAQERRVVLVRVGEQLREIWRHATGSGKKMELAASAEEGGDTPDIGAAVDSEPGSVSLAALAKTHAGESAPVAEAV